MTNAGRILGLGDLGANGMGIPIGKLQLYTAAAGVPPQGLLPMYLDAGTNNETYLRDPLYVGLRRQRPSTEELYAFVDEFVEAVQEVFPNCCIHFEDWTGVDAIALLARYRDKVSCYNDDIQGTAGVVLAGLINALKITGGQLKDQRILFLGAGSAAIGLADLIVSALGQQGVAPDVARQQIRMFDTQGLVVAGRPGLAAHKLPYAHKLPPSKPFNPLDLASECPQIVAAIEDFKPTALIGVSTVGKLFSREVVEAMSRHNARPIIFALSNPIEKHECLPEEAYAWSEGKAVYAGGVQFPPVHLGGQTFLPSQANNLYIFPAVGMAIYATQREARDRRNVHRGRTCRRRPGDPRAVEAGDALPAAVEHPGSRDQDGGPRGQGGVREQPRARRTPGGLRGIHSEPRLQAGVPQRPLKSRIPPNEPDCGRGTGPSAGVDRQNLVRPYVAVN